MGPKSPGPAELIRACQRDNEFIKRLKQDIDEMVLEVFGQRVWLRCQEYSQHVSGVIYYALTNLMGNQTLGEEYVGVVQIDKSQRSIPSKKAMALMIFVESFGTPFINYIIKIMENFNDRESRTQHVPKIIKYSIQYLVGIGHFYQSFVPLLTQLHLAIFYMNSKFYQVSKRLSGIHYFLLRPYFGNEDAISKLNLKYLMWMSILNLAVTATHDSFQFISKRSKKSGDVENCQNREIENRSVITSEVDSTRKCSLCLEMRRYPSVTPCGHLFCWDCIMDWLRNEGVCPMCRESITQSRIVPLQNFS